jgi:hypothetical protein
MYYAQVSNHAKPCLLLGIANFKETLRLPYIGVITPDGWKSICYY